MIPGGIEIPKLTVGNRVFTDLDNLILLIASCNTGGSANNSTFRLPSASAGYVVPTGKTLYIRALQFDMRVTAVTATPVLCYSDNDVGINSNTAYTNQVYPGGSAFLGSHIMQSVGIVQVPVQFDVPEAKYPGMAGDTALGFTCKAWGYVR